MEVLSLKEMHRAVRVSGHCLTNEHCAPVIARHVSQIPSHSFLVLPALCCQSIFSFAPFRPPPSVLPPFPSILSLLPLPLIATTDKETHSHSHIASRRRTGYTTATANAPVTAAAPFISSSPSFHLTVAEERNFIRTRWREKRSLPVCSPHL